MTDTLKNNSFPGFEYPVEQLSKYCRSGEIFTILLQTCEIINFTEKDAFLNTKDKQDQFETWLKNHRIVNIKEESAHLNKKK
ncbi:hypothetical protein WG906_18185 [Pedobacter sp. P351]|uniref:hypothetical protein n=1 Tax=Pedobacter superstes TaxID=3133441 RepID=UPI0030B53545